MRGRVAALVVLAAACPGSAWAGLPDPPFAYWRWSVVPSQPTTRGEVLLRNATSGCEPAAGARAVEIDQATGLINFYLGESSDTCERYYYDDIRDTRLGYLRAGAYSVRFITCGSPYDPADACFELVQHRLGFVVTDAGRPRQVIPAWSFAGAFATAFLLAGFALVRLRPRSR
jgi:hypothetical protein